MDPRLERLGHELNRILFGWTRENFVGLLAHLGDKRFDRLIKGKSGLIQLAGEDFGHLLELVFWLVTWPLLGVVN